jgi:Reversibly glycosylated polypeptide
MNNKNVCIVLTTINAGGILDDYCKQAESEGIRDQLQIIVIPDRKTPEQMYKKCGQIRADGFDIKCPTVEEQDNYLKKLGTFSTLVPYNSDNRRNIGYLMALESGDSILLSIDDDNYCIGETYKTSGVVCEEAVTLPAIHSSNGWFNFCEMLDIEPNCQFYPRGFPYHKRHQERKLTFIEETGPVRMNVGLWLQEPDLDAITWLTAPVRATGFKGKSLLLGNDTWSPINTQNTALHRDLIVSYYFVRMGYPLAGMPIDRYGDIFSGYLAQACIRHMGHRIRVGTPVADHKRNSHNYLRDLTGELACILTLEPFTEWLHDLKLEGANYAETYLSLADAIDHQVQHFSGQIWTDATRGYFHQMTYCMRQWVSACRLIH